MVSTIVTSKDPQVSDEARLQGNCASVQIFCKFEYPPVGLTMVTNLQNNAREVIFGNDPDEVQQC